MEKWYILRENVKDKALYKSLISATAQMWWKHDWVEKQERESKRYKFYFHFSDSGPYFTVTDKNTGIEYSVNMYDASSVSDGIYWGAYLKEPEQ